MSAIIIYALGVMYTPGPVNLLGLNAGLNGQAKASFGFYLGVGLAMLTLFLLFGWAGAAWVQGDTLIVLSALGCGYIGYLAIKIAGSSIDLGAVRQAPRVMRFRDGLIMQLCNPKGIVATLPIATIQFPAAEIHGVSLVLWSIGLAMLAVGAPGSYALIGALLGKRIENPIIFKGFNLAMAILLAGVALSIGYEHVWLPLAARMD
ncbi:Threonine/homoserine/homoserine lactone efflux protein [Modicisalibacter ilicicola DSM 19980]|uniref:Threonine/homoserine/homoserine lactone efflux protein n=1 Tax=Modicisalibacter ilicicola DSM 19980 TaxID=1121942 RepID=A0A1M4TMH5_9GAMM|nr:LysE family transporter [Halomonas ilicicola]SHE45683.1 Threonine/homoserine/homoserine lactone efflux protein [Halomonas ilicicola DSM 19980]